MCTDAAVAASSSGALWIFHPNLLTYTFSVGRSFQGTSAVFTWIFFSGGDLSVVSVL